MVGAFALVLTASAAWGEVAVLAAFEPGDDLPFLWGWSTVSIIDTDTAGSASLGSLEVISDTASGYFTASFDPIDATSMPYVNFYVNVEGVTSFDAEGSSMFAFGGGGYVSDSVTYPAAGTAGWQYISANIGDFTPTGTWDPAAFASIEVNAGDLVGTLLFDHVTASTTPEEGMLGAGGGGGGGGGPVAILGTWTQGLTHAAETGSDRLLVFTTHAEDGGSSDLTAVTYGGQAMTKIIEEGFAPGDVEAYIAAFVLDEAGIAAASGSDFVVTWAAPPSPAGYASVFLSGVNQTTPIGASSSGESEVADVTSAALATSAGDMVLVGAQAGTPDGTYTFNNDFPVTLEFTVDDTMRGIVGFKVATGAAETPSATHTAINRHVIIGLVVQGGGGDGPPPVVPAVDTDGDGFLDSVEVALGFDPNDAGDAPPATPVAGLLGLGLLSLGVLAGGAALVRRKK